MGTLSVVVVGLDVVPFVGCVVGFDVVVCLVGDGLGDDGVGVLVV